MLGGGEDGFEGDEGVEGREEGRGRGKGKAVDRDDGVMGDHWD